MRIAHLSDLHLLPPGALRATGMFGRRLLGATNLVLVRKWAHSTDMARAAVREVLRQGVDHSVITGDLTNLSLRTEFELAVDVVAPLGGYDRLTVIPGNHDYYTPGAVRERAFERWFGGSLWEDGDGSWPAIKDLGDVVVVAICSATVPPAMRAWGRVGPEQTEAASAAIRRAREQGKDAVAILHHNLHDRGRFQEAMGRLLDKAEVSDMLADAGAALVLHGHDHREHEMVLTGRGGAGRGTPAIGCGSTTSGLAGRGRPGRFNIYTIRSGDVEIERWEYRARESAFRPRAD